MIWWWIANVILLLAVIPVVIMLLNTVIRPAIEIKKYGDDILEHGVKLSGTLDGVPEALTETVRLAQQLREPALRYARTVQRLL